jgi:transcriptional regulator with XRE-family HTH domain
MVVSLSKIDKSLKSKMKSHNSDLGKHFRELRKEKGETLHQVSKGTDIDSPMLSKIERGERMPTLEQLKKLCKYFKVAEADLKVMHTAEKIIKEYGVNETTYEAVRMVSEQIVPYLKKSKAK